MKKLTKKYSVQLAGLLLLLALLPVSCIKDDYAAKEKATVQVTFTTRAISGSSDTDAEALEMYEHMRTLRVIVARASDNDILYNVKYDIAENETSKTITFSELTIEKGGELFDFYAIANESGVGYTSDWATITVEQLENISLTEDALAKLNLGKTYIPQTAHAQINVGEATGDVTIPLQFAVAKVRLTIENTSTDQQTVNDISLSGVNTTSTKLFGATPVTATDTGKALSLGNMVFSAETNGTPGKNTVYAYFFENQNSEGYTLTAFWKKDQTLPLQTGSDDNKQPITEIPRGKMLDITIKLNADVDIEPTINVQVDEWTGKTINVPSFQ